MSSCINIRSTRTSILVLRLVRCLLLLDRTVVVHEHECAFIFRVRISLRALVPRAEVTRGVVAGEGSFGGALLLSSAEIFLSTLTLIRIGFLAHHKVLTARVASSDAETRGYKNRAEDCICGGRCRPARFQP